MKKYIGYTITLAVLEIALALYLNTWREHFWNYVEARNFHGFIVQIGIFTVVALAFCFVNAYGSYFISLCSIEWRYKLDNKFREKYKEKDY